MLTATGWWAVESWATHMQGLGPAVACWTLTASLALRASGASGRVRTRLLLLAGSAAAGGVYRAAIDVMSAHPWAWGLDVRPVLGSVVVTGVTVVVGLGVAGLTVATGAGTGRHLWLRHVLDGIVTAGSVFLTGWVLLRGPGGGWQLETGMVGVLWGAEIVFLGFLFALRGLVRGDHRTTVWVAAAGLSLMLIGDTLRLWRSDPDTPEEMPFQLADFFSTAGLLVVAAGPWVPGGASVLGTGGSKLWLGLEGTAAFVPLTVFTVMALGYALAPLAGDPVPLLVGGTVLLGFWARRALVSSENIGDFD
ncbi:hypothetical protein [Streptomyces acidicola]|uniref:hypothetical protein n=1 Tax=Streptomyces acidicola TaxID=2596892 RepID=UPI0037FDE18F